MSKTLTPAQFERSERNRQKALLLRDSRLSKKPYSDPKRQAKARKEEIDSGAGFLIDPDEEEERERTVRLVESQAPMLGIAPHSGPVCRECDKPFTESFLLSKFDELICDECRENDVDDKHALITRTDAKQQYLLKDCDLDQREPLLRFIVRKNPHNSTWSDMKLYLKAQVVKRSYEIWGGKEELESQLAKRAENKQQMKERKYVKKIKELRRAVRTSLWQKKTGSHEHEFDDEIHNEEDDTWTKTCTLCDFSLTYEKM
ncbi:DNA repair protein complementing XP-A cells-like [Oscarella lobularis]|uniref:DNA repair protein complementing XP-A cells-like n=1 Tax=Oscarella lobularis TaxID=121494 RepID=UPI0033134309